MNFRFGKLFLGVVSPPGKNKRHTPCAAIGVNRPAAPAGAPMYPWAECRSEKGTPLGKPVEMPLGSTAGEPATRLVANAVVA